MLLERITVFCFAASYGCALLLELIQLWRPTRLARPIILTAGFAGFVAHSAYLAFHGAPMSGRSPSLLFLSWILTVFYLYGSVHHRGRAWGVFVLPVVLALVLAGSWSPGVGYGAEPVDLQTTEQAWAWLHAALLILGAVGVCVGFVASVMYLVQARKVKQKLLTDEGLHLLSLERLELMNRRAINWAFPVFSAGLLIGLFLWNREEFSWLDAKVLSTAGLWIVFIVLLYLRYGLRVQGRRMAFGTIGAFLLLLVAFTAHLMLPTAHRFGGSP